jgi:hypothetical protein
MRAATQRSIQQDPRTEPEKLTDLLGELSASSASLVRDEVDLATTRIVTPIMTALTDIATEIFR